MDERLTSYSNKGRALTDQPSLLAVKVTILGVAAAKLAWDGHISQLAQLLSRHMLYL